MPDTYVQPNCNNRVKTTKVFSPFGFNTVISNIFNYVGLTSPRPIKTMTRPNTILNPRYKAK